MRVHIADNHEILIEGLKAVLKAINIEVEGYSTDGAKVIMWREQHEADILILDVSMPIMNGYDVLKHFKEKGIKQKTLMFTAYNDYQFIDQSVKYGASGYLLKDDGGSLIQALEAIYNGGKYFSKKVIKRILDNVCEETNPVHKSISRTLLGDVMDNPRIQLTSQEQEVLRLISQRFHLDDIKKKMNIKDATLRVYLHNIREKLNIKTTEDLIKYSIIIS